MPEHIPPEARVPDPATPILIVDDEQVLRELISQALIDFAVSTAKGGREAIDLLKESEYEMVITDLMMPQCDGFAILEAVRDLEKHPDVLVLTGYPSIENQRRCRDLGCWDIMPKPFAVTRLRQIVTECLIRRQQDSTRQSSRDDDGNRHNQR